MGNKILTKFWMHETGKSLLLSIGLMSLVSGCDAMLQLTYTVENKSKSNITLLIPNYPIDNIHCPFGNYKDTTVVLLPQEKVIVGFTNKIDFPWSTKKIYKNNPGKCGLKLIKDDSTTEVSCLKTNWKYKRRNSNFTFR